MSYDTFNTILRASGSCLGPQYHDRTLMVDQAMVTLRWRCPHRAPSASSHLTGHSAPGLPIPLSCTPSLSIRLRAEGEAVKDGQDAQTHLCLFFFLSENLKNYTKKYFSLCYLLTKIHHKIIKRSVVLLGTIG